jgi:hypothetical protein
MLITVAGMVLVACESDGRPGAQPPVDPDGLAETVANATATMLANGDQTTAERYAADVRDRTGCTVQTSGVAYADSPKNRSLERRQRTELIEQLLERPTVTAVATARRPVGTQVPSTIGRRADADVVGVVVALTCA